MTASFTRRAALSATAGLTTAALIGRAKAQRAPIRVGVLTDMAGVYAANTGPGSVAGAELAVEDFQKAHPDIPVEVVAADLQLKPDVALAIAGKWLDSDGVDLITDVPLSSAAFAIGDLVKQKDKLAIFTGGASADITGGHCGPNHLHWVYDTWSMPHGVVDATVKEGGDTWFFITADYAFGKDLESNCADAVGAAGGKVLGSARHPLNTADFSSFLLQAQASGADVIGLANAGGDLSNTIKQAHEFGLTAKQRLAGLILNVTNIPSLGLEAVQNAAICTPFYWDFNDGTRDFAARFQADHPSKMKPNDMHAGMYAATLHLMKAMAETKSAADGVKLIDAMKAIPTDDPLFGKGSIRVDGRKLHPVYLMTAKTLAESKGDWDYFKLVATIKPEDAWRPLDKGGCPFVKA